MASRKLSTITKYKKGLKKLLNDNIVDIILFGSLVKQGIPNDIDIALLVKDKNNVLETKKRIRDLISKKTDIEIIDLESIHSPIWLTLIKEGFSIKKDKRISELYNIKPSVLYRYKLTELTNVQKVQFERGIDNVLKEGGKKIARSIVLIPLKMKGEMTDFLKNWKVYYTCQEYELLPLMRKEVFL